MAKPGAARRVQIWSLALLVLSFPVLAVTRAIDDRPMSMLGLIPIVLAAIGAVGLRLSSRALAQGNR